MAAADDSDAAPRRHPVRTALILVILAALLAGGLWGGWRYTQSKYYVGVTDDGTVAVFQGIPGAIAGFELSTVDYLSEHQHRRPDPGGPGPGAAGDPGADSQAEARDQLRRLLDPAARTCCRSADAVDDHDRPADARRRRPARGRDRRRPVRPPHPRVPPTPSRRSGWPDDQPISVPLDELSRRLPDNSHADADRT